MTNRPEKNKENLMFQLNEVEMPILIGIWNGCRIGYYELDGWNSKVCFFPSQWYLMDTKQFWGRKGQKANDEAEKNFWLSETDWICIFPQVSVHWVVYFFLHLKKIIKTFSPALSCVPSACKVWMYVFMDELLYRVQICTFNTVEATQFKFIRAILSVLRYIKNAAI